MKQKILTIIFGMILLTGNILAANELYNLKGIDLPENIIAGNEFVANFSFDYPYYSNENNSEFILQLNFTSNDSSYPIWKGDFEVNGYMQKCYIDTPWKCLLSEKIYFNCSEEYNQTISFLEGKEDIFAPNGTFYCYTEEGNLALNEHDDVFLNIRSNPALYPSKYNLTASMYYLTDEYPPLINITNKADFENKYYGKNDKVDVWVNVTDGSPISQVHGRAYGIYENGGNLDFNNYILENKLYKFQEDTGENDLKEGDFDLVFYATDEEGNTANDSTTLKIDLTPPNITLKEPTGIVSENFTIKFNVTDEKAGVDNGSVQVRLREIVNGQICPKTGGPIGNYSCTTTEWINLELNQTSRLFEVEINATELGLSSNEYWLDAKASDILGNKAEWIVDED